MYDVHVSVLGIRCTSYTQILSEWMPTVDSTRRISIATAVLLLVATVAGVAASAVLPALTGPEYLTRASNHAGLVACAGLFYLVAAATSVGIAIALYPLLRKTDAAMALGALVFRTIEAVFYTAAVVALLSLTTLGQQFLAAPPAGRAPIQAISDYVLSVRDHSTLAGVFAFSVGTFMYSAVFYRSRLIPRALSAWGLAGALLMGTACVLALFADHPVTGYSLLFLPIAVWEMVLAIWLLAKGFTTLPRTTLGTAETTAGLIPSLAGR